MKILVILTGGTIGSSAENGWIAPNRKNNGKLICHYTETHHDGVIFETVSPYTVLSENLSARELTLLTAVIEQNSRKDYDGFIVAHGTDTLQYSAVAAEQCFQATKLPIVFVSSNYPLDDGRANGYFNFEAAVELIKSRVAGTFICYKNGDDAVHIIEPSKVIGHLEMSDSVFCLGEPFAKYKDGKFSGPLFSTAVAENNIGAVSFIDQPGILVVRCSPAMPFYVLDNIKAVILMPYHSGTVNTQSEALRTLCSEAKQKHIPVYLPDATAGFAYESKKVFEDYGIIPLCDTTFFTAFVRIWIEESLGNR